MKIQWSNRALISYIDNLEFILLIWNEKTTLDFIELVQDTLNRLKKNPFIGKPFNKNIRQIILHKNASLFYEINEKTKTINILFKTDNRQNPKDYSKLL